MPTPNSRSTIWILLTSAFAAALLNHCRPPDRPAADPALDPAHDAHHAVAERVAHELRALLAALPAETPLERARRGSSPASAPALRGLYARRAEQPLWSRGHEPRPAARQLLAALTAAADDGLEASDYGAGEIRRLWSELRAGASAAERIRRLAELDLLLTQAFLGYGGHLLSGRVEPRRAGWHTQPRRLDLERRLLLAVDSDDVIEGLRALAPRHRGYTALRHALAEYRRLQAASGWPRVPAATVAGPQAGAAEPDVAATSTALAALRARLAATGELPPPVDLDAPDFDAALQEALQRFQRRHGLEPTGRLDQETLAELNVPVAERVAQIELNLERWRWLPQQLGARHLLVNIPDFTLQVIEGETPVGRLRVVVGKTSQPTPVFSDVVTHLELNPFWNVPAGILRQEILPAVRRDPGYLAQEEMEVLAGWGDAARTMAPEEIDWAAVSPHEIRVRQRPGSRNSLGRIKFLFPNRFQVYLHDSPARHLFARRERPFSHGCIRVERPLDLAAQLLHDHPEWTRERLEEAVSSGARRGVRLPRPVPIHILYWTAWVDADGELQFRHDLYARDPALERALRPAVAADA